MKKDNLNYLFSLESKGIKLGLEKTEELLAACENPQNKFTSIQVVGTNGKGSTSAMISNILKVAGYKVGLYTSPHLNRINERIRVNGKSISNSKIDEFISKFHLNINKINSSFFEAMTAMAAWYFNQQKVDIAILETGLGGRLDSVTCCQSKILVCTSISKDHEHILGETIEKIAYEKISALKNNMICISENHAAPIKKVFENYIENINSNIVYVKKKKNYFSVNLNGKHQFRNEQLAIETIKHIKQFKVSEKHINEGLKTIKWPARIQKIYNNPETFFDVAHNVQSFESLCDYANTKNKPKVLLLALQKNKKIADAIKEIEKTFDKIIITQSNVRNFYLAEDLSKLFSKKTLTINNPREALKQCMLRFSQYCIFIAGSHYLGPTISEEFKISFDNI